MADSLVTRADRLGAAVLTLDSLANRNALSRQLVADLGGHLSAAAADDGVRVVAITATGGTFCAGADLSDPPVQAGQGSFADVLEQLWSYPKPVVVAVNGHVRAGGFGLVASADICISSDAATFAFTETRLGLVPAIISVPCLRRMTAAAATRFLLTGEQFGPAEAVSAGLVWEVVPDAELGSALDEVLGQFRTCEPEALRVTRELLRQIPAMTVQEGFSRAAAISAATFGSETAAEGIASFREKRPPRWAL
ncbi:MAG TPA: enoyl-CoA hydratase-related protein [Acidimicrobiales bacterium]|nr:enoyl-CoA hydratase-related protein [Acidimicrobiales bacterium]